MVVDVTVYPANAKLVGTALDSLGLLLNMAGNHNAAHVQLPICHTNTTSQVVYKHRRLVEDNLMSAQKLDISQTVALHSKPDEGHASDKRGGVQTCLFVTADQATTSWQSPQVIGPIPLIRVRDMVGFDSENRPGATARAEQKPECNRSILDEFCSVSVRIDHCSLLLTFVLYSKVSGIMLAHFAPHDL